MAADEPGEAGPLTPEELGRLVYSPRTKSYLCGRVGPAALEDALQDVYLAALTSLRQKSQIRDAGAYVYGICRFVSARHINHQMRRRGQFDLDPRMRSNAPTPEQIVLEKDQVREVARALEALPPRERELLARAYLRAEPQVRTMAEMRLTRTQYRLSKSRAKAKVVKISSRTRSRRALQVIAAKRAA